MRAGLWTKDPSLPDSDTAREQSPLRCEQGCCADKQRSLSGSHTDISSLGLSLTARVLFKFSKELLTSPQKKPCFCEFPSGLRPGSVLQDRQSKVEAFKK